MFGCMSRAIFCFCMRSASWKSQKEAALLIGTCLLCEPIRQLLTRAAVVFCIPASVDGQLLQLLLQTMHAWFAPVTSPLPFLHACGENDKKGNSVCVCMHACMYGTAQFNAAHAVV